MEENEKHTFEWTWARLCWYERLLLVIGPGLFLAELIMMALGAL